MVELTIAIGPYGSSCSYLRHVLRKHPVKTIPIIVWNITTIESRPMSGAFASHWALQK